MRQEYILFLILFGLFNLGVSAKGFYESNKKRNAYGEIFLLTPLGIFVWGDAAIFGIFWFLASSISVLLLDVYLFPLIASLFVVVRSLGETMYWFNQQFSTITREQPNGHRFLYKYFHNDSVWFVYQILNQCVTVAGLVATLYFAHMWLGQF